MKLLKHKSQARMRLFNQIWHSSTYGVIVLIQRGEARTVAFVELIVLCPQLPNNFFGRSCMAM